MAVLAWAASSRSFFTMVIDPVCGIDFEEVDAASSDEFEGLTYYFCSDVCRDEFEANPHRFAVAPSDSAAAPGTV